MCEYKGKPAFWASAKRILHSNLCREVVYSLTGDIRDTDVVDIGCGAGHMSRLLKENGAARVRGIDIDAGVVDIAIALERERPMGIDYKVGTALALPYEDESFDLALSVLVFGHFSGEGMESAVRETYRVLRSEGRAVVAVPHPLFYVLARESELVQFKYSPDEFDYWRTSVAHIELRRGDSEEVQPIPARHHTFSEYTNILVGSGLFSLLRMEEVGTSADDRHPSYLVMLLKKE